MNSETFEILIKFSKIYGELTRRRSLSEMFNCVNEYPTYKDYEKFTSMCLTHEINFKILHKFYVVMSELSRRPMFKDLLNHVDDYPTENDILILSNICKL